MDGAPLNVAFSPCPNDTFAFHALVHGLVPGPPVVPFLDDVEALNERAARGEAEVTKLSIAAFGHVRERYALLHAGGAAGFGVGPIVVARGARAVGGRIAIPGARTTAALLLTLLGEFETVPMRFDQIEDAVRQGRVDCGVLIHEGRFTYQAKGLTCVADLGAEWEARMHCPLPLGAIAIRRDLIGRAAAIDRAIRASVEHARAHPDDSASYVAAHAQEMDPVVTQQHIRLYVNDYTVSLDEGAVAALVTWGEQQGAYPRAADGLSMFV